MKSIFSFLLMLTAANAFAAPPIGPDVTSRMKSAEARYGLANFKMVMPGVLYRGGSSNDAEAPMSASSAKALCEDGFTAATYVYSKGWSGGEQALDCSNGTIRYAMKQWDRPERLRDALTALHTIIVSGRGAMYVHCWHGVHASGYVVTAALMQFCGLSAEEGVSYWNSNVAASIRYPKVQNMIRAFRPFSDLQISADQRARVCPSGL